MIKKYPIYFISTFIVVLVTSLWITSCSNIKIRKDEQKYIDAAYLQGVALMLKDSNDIKGPLLVLNSIDEVSEFMINSPNEYYGYKAVAKYRLSKKGNLYYKYLDCGCDDAGKVKSDNSFDSPLFLEIDLKLIGPCDNFYFIRKLVVVLGLIISLFIIYGAYKFIKRIKQKGKSDKNNNSTNNDIIDSINN